MSTLSTIKHFNFVDPQHPDTLPVLTYTNTSKWNPLNQSRINFTFNFMTNFIRIKILSTLNFHLIHYLITFLSN